VRYHVGVSKPIKELEEIVRHFLFFIVHLFIYFSIIFVVHLIIVINNRIVWQFSTFLKAFAIHFKML